MNDLDLRRDHTPAESGRFVLGYIYALTGSLLVVAIIAGLTWAAYLLVAG